jgi:hypothetical protein
MTCKVRDEDECFDFEGTQKIVIPYTQKIGSSPKNEWVKSLQTNAKVDTSKDYATPNFLLSTPTNISNGGTILLT